MESFSDASLFASMGLALRIQPMKTTLEVFMTQYFNASEGYSRSIDACIFRCFGSRPNRSSTRKLTSPGLGSYEET